MLDQANRLLNSNNKQSILKAYNSYKTLYIRSILESDDRLKKEALKGLIKSSKKLGYSYKDYEQKLKKLTSNKDIVEKKEVRKIDKRVVLRSIKLKKGLIELHFSIPIDKKSIKSFVLANKRESIYKRVFDIEAIWPKVKKIYNLRTIKRLKVAQFDKKITRIVLEDGRPLKIDYRVDKNVMKIYLKKPLAKKEQKTNKSQNFNFRSTKVIVIDPGHGGNDPGAIGYKRKKEKDVVLQIAKKLFKELKRRGYRAYLTRSKDYFVKLMNRTKYANKKMADIFISLHANAAPKKSKYLSMRGIETFFLSPAKSKRAKRVAALENRADLDSMGYYSKLTFLNFLNREKIIASNKLAIDIQKGMIYNLKMHFKNVHDGGVREGPFWVLVGAQMPSVLIEVGYITNPTEAKRLFNPYYQQLLAKGIADGIDSYFEKNQ